MKIIMTKTPKEYKKRITKQKVLGESQKNEKSGEKSGENTELYMNV